MRRGPFAAIARRTPGAVDAQEMHAGERVGPRQCCQKMEPFDASQCFEERNPEAWTIAKTVERVGVQIERVPGQFRGNSPRPSPLRIWDAWQQFAVDQNTGFDSMGCRQT